jgi:hypothetical protein
MDILLQAATEAATKDADYTPVPETRTAQD